MTRCGRWRSSIPYRVRFHLHDAVARSSWPTMVRWRPGRGGLCPKSTSSRVGDDGFKKHPIGLGPYKFVSHTPGIELVMEAVESYWRQVPHVKRLVFKSVPEATTRLAMLKRGEVDIAYLLEAPHG